MTAAVWPRKHRTYPPAVVRFYVDADVLALAKILVQLRNDVTYPGDPGRGSVARMLALAGTEAIGTGAQVELLMNRWRAIEELLGLRCPFIYSATRTRLRRVDLG